MACKKAIWDVPILMRGSPWLRLCSNQAKPEQLSSAHAPYRGGTPKLQPEVATTAWGTGAFRVLNFELYARPEGWNKVAAYVGSASFLAVLAYFTFSEENRQASKVTSPSVVQS
jgi:hypothetical protein